MIVLPEMVEIEPGEFMMGSPKDEEGRNDNETPQHLVCIQYRFEVSKNPVTFAEWDAAVEDSGCDGYRPHDGVKGRKGYGRGKRPVINVSWDDAQDYITWINKRTGKEYRLLTEAEWEYCCRAGTTTPYSYGERFILRRPFFDHLQRFVFGTLYPLQTEPVDRFPTNRFGLAGMHDNVKEWCMDCWNDDYAIPGRPDDGAAWLTGHCAQRVLRGGCWANLPEKCRSASRARLNRDARSELIGFRIARTL